MFMGNLTLAVTVQRLSNRTTSQIALKDHIDEWRRTFDARLKTRCYVKREASGQIILCQLKGERLWVATIICLRVIRRSFDFSCYRQSRLNVP